MRAVARDAVQLSRAMASSFPIASRTLQGPRGAAQMAAPLAGRPSAKGVRSVTMAAAGKRVIALDFDGVVCDSCGESSLSAFKVRAGEPCTRAGPIMPRANAPAPAR